MQAQEPSTVKELIEQAAQHLGSQAALARAISKSPQLVTNWKQGYDSCPYEMQATIAELAGLDPKEWVWKQIQQARGKESPSKSRLRKILHASALGVLAMLGTFGANDRAQAAAAGGPGARGNEPSRKRQDRASPA